MLTDKIELTCSEEDNMYLVSQGDSGFCYFVIRFNVRPKALTASLGWSLGEPRYDGDIWTRDVSCEDLHEELLANYDYLAIFSKDDGFIEDYGKHDVVILLHGGGLSWWNYREVAELLQAHFHVILPILDGHAGSDRAFTTIEENAREILDFIDERFGGSVLMIGGLSLGGQILLEILSQRKDACRYALVESARVIPSKMTAFFIKPAFGSCYSLIQYPWFSKCQFQSLKIHSELFADYFRDTCQITKQDMIAFLQANSLYTLKPSISHCSAKVHIFVGEKETQTMRRSAEEIHKRFPGSTLRVLPRLYHGEFSINHAAAYGNWVLEIVKER